MKKGLLLLAAAAVAVSASAQYKNLVWLLSNAQL